MPRTGKPPLVEDELLVDLEPEPVSALPAVEGGKRPPRTSVEDEAAVSLMAAMLMLFATQRISITATGSIEYAMNDEEADRIGAPIARIVMRHLPHTLGKSGDIADCSVIATALIAYTMRLAAIRDRTQAQQPKQPAPPEMVNAYAGWTGGTNGPG